MYAYEHRDQVSLKIFYFPLEETPERVLERFMSYLLYKLDNKRISPRDLRSSKNDKPLPQEILNLIESEKYQKILKFYEECVVFGKSTNPTGIFKECKEYAETNGEVHYKTYSYINDMGEECEGKSFDYYIPNNSKEFRIIMIDHLGIIDTERGMTLKQSMDKMSEYCSKYLRNRYGFSSVIIQQQAMEKESAFNVTNNQDTPNAQGLGDSKYSARDCNIMLGLYSPFKFNRPEYKGYDITKFKDNIRFLEVVINRDGQTGGVCPLFFDGAVCNFKELPLPSDSEHLNKVYEHLEKIRTQFLFISNSLKQFLNG